MHVSGFLVRDAGRRVGDWGVCGARRVLRAGYIVDWVRTATASTKIGVCDAHLILAARGNPAPVLEGLEPWWLRPEGASRLRIGLRGRSDGRPAIP